MAKQNPRSPSTPWLRTTALAATIATIALQTTVTPASAATRQPDSAPITLTIADYYASPPASVEFTKIISEYDASHPNVRIVASLVPQPSFVSKMLEDAAGGNTPDLIAGDNPDVPDFTKAGILAPITPYLAAAGLSEKSFFSGPIIAGTWHGALYALPVGLNVELLYYNKTMLANAGLAVPTTWSQMTSAAAKLTDKAKSVYGFAASGYAGEETSWDWETYFWELGGSFSNLDSSAGIRSLTYWTSFLKDGTSPQAELTNSYVQGFASEFAEKQFALAQMGSWDLPLVTSEAPKTGLSWGITTLPTPSAGEAPTPPFGGELFTIGRTDSAHELAAWDFLDWLYAPQRISAFDYAIGYVPALKAAIPGFVAAHPAYAVVAKELSHSESRTAQLAYNYPAASTDLWTVIPEIMDGSVSVSAGAKTLNSELAPLVVVK